MAQPYLSIIIPAYNEAERIPRTLIDIDKRLEGAPYSYEIIVVCDGCTDNTGEVARNMAKMVRNLKVIELVDNLGKGGTVRHGMLAAMGKIRLFTDADNSTSIDQFEAMMPFFKEGYAVVIGSRTAEGAKLDPPETLARRIAGKIGNLIFQGMLGIRAIWDTQCGFKAFTDEAAEKLFKDARIGGFGFDVEILVLAMKMGYKIKEIPVHWVNDPGSKVSASSYLKVLFETCRIRWYLWTGAYDRPEQ